MLRALLPTLAPLAAAVALAAAAVSAAGRMLERMHGEAPYEVTWVPRGDALRVASPAIRLSFANYYWLSTVQYLGDPHLRRRGVDKLFPLVDLVTDLDPQHGYAYQTAGIMLSAFGRLEESDRILRKGMERGPSWWSYPYQIAFNHFFYRGDYAEAARWAEIAARTPGARPSVSHLAMSLSVKSGRTDHALAFLRELRSEAKDEATAKALDHQYKLALLQKELARLDAAVEAFERATGRRPARFEELVSGGQLERLPGLDPFGAPYALQGGVVYPTGEGHRFKRRETPPLLRRPEAAASPSPATSRTAP